MVWWHDNFYIDLMNPIHTTTQPLDSRQLRAFVTLAKTASFTRCGQELFLSQSAVSHSLKGLENDIGCRLFDRLGKRMHLTPAGEHLLHYAEKILHEMASARESITRLGKWGKGRLRLAASSTVCRYILPNVLRDFRKEFPDWLVSLELADAPQAVELLRERAIDLAFTLAPPAADSFEFVPLFTDELAFLVAPGHPWSALGRVVREDIPTQNFILYRQPSHTFQLVEKYFHREGMVLRLAIETGSMDAIKELVKLGLGVGVLAPWVARRELEEKSLLALPLGKRKLKRSWGVLRAHGGKPGLAEETLVKLWAATVGMSGAM